MEWCQVAKGLIVVQAKASKSDLGAVLTWVIFSNQIDMKRQKSSMV